MIQGLLALFGVNPRPDLADGLRELNEFIRDVGGGRIGPPTRGPRPSTFPCTHATTRATCCASR